MDAAWSFRFLLVVSLSHATLSSHAREIFSYDLNDGNKIPAFALGTSLGHAPNGTRILSVNHSLGRAVQWALEAGYRHIDTAALYRTHEDVGYGIHNYLKDNNKTRHQVFVTTKLWNDSHKKDEVVPALRKALQELQLDYVDLYLIHMPMAFNKDGSFSLTDYLETWEGMEEAKNLNLTRSIGVSNFNMTQMKRLWDNSRIKPAVLQIEVTPSITNVGLVDWCRERGVVVMAYSIFGAILGRKPPNRPPPPVTADNALLQSLSKKYKKTVAQILIRYILDRKLVAIARSMDEDRIKQNIDVLDFELTPDEVDSLSALNTNYSLRDFAQWRNHPYFPFPLTS